MQGNPINTNQGLQFEKLSHPLDNGNDSSNPVQMPTSKENSICKRHIIKLTTTSFEKMKATPRHTCDKRLISYTSSCQCQVSEVDER